MFPYCRICKGYRKMCGLSSCPITDSIKVKNGTLSIKTGEVSSVTPPGIFIGAFNYPKVYAGPMAVIDPGLEYPTGKEYGRGMDEILALNSNLYRASRRTYVGEIDGNYSRYIQEAAMSSNYVDMEMNISRKIGGSIDRDPSLESPLSSMVEINSLQMSSNAKIPNRVEHFHNDTDLRAGDAVWKLYRSGFDIRYLEGVFSSGSLGLGKSRKLVPTRWAITAVDDILYKKIKEEILNYDIISEVYVFNNSYLGNSFTIILLPYSLSYEMQELWDDNSIWGGEQKVSIDYEFAKGRKEYANEVGGAYYAARLAAFEYLAGIRRQASVIILRCIGGEYYSPLGVWVVRETVRDAFKKRERRYSSIGEMMKNENPGIRNWYGISRVAGQAYVQKRIMDYF